MKSAVYSYVKNKGKGMWKSTKSTNEESAFDAKNKRQKQDLPTPKPRKETKVKQLLPASKWKKKLSFVRVLLGFPIPLVNHWKWGDSVPNIQVTGRCMLQWSWIMAGETG